MERTANRSNFKEIQLKSFVVKVKRVHRMDHRSCAIVIMRMENDDSLVCIACNER